MNYTYLALGDSYTIGEQVLPAENFPNQTVKILNDTANNEHHFAAPEIIATTGWTTDELDAAITAENILKQYDIVSLLIGVNNQYRGRSIKNFEKEFDHLLQRAIKFSGDKPNHVFVLSIPDWGITPFAIGKDINKIAEEIDLYNVACENISKKFGAHYIDITTAQRINGNKKEFLTIDNLHPSAKEYTKWALQLASVIKAAFNF